MVFYGSLPGTLSVISESVYPTGESSAFVVLVNKRREDLEQDEEDLSLDEITNSINTYLTGTSTWPTIDLFDYVYECKSAIDTNANHVAADRAYTITTGYLFWKVTTYYAIGSNDNLGTNGSATVTLYSKDQEATWSTTECQVQEKCTDDAYCDDGQYCNGVEYCDTNHNCQSGTPVDCSDGVGCTVDSCNEATDSCDNALDHSACDDDDSCTQDFCDPVLGCDYVDIPECGCLVETTSLIEHRDAGRAFTKQESCGWNCTQTVYYATGSEENLGTDGNVERTLYSNDEGTTWSTTEC